MPFGVNVLANNLTNSRYFNYTLVDSIKPDPIEKPLELPPDLQALVDQQNIDVDESNLLSPEQRQLAKARQLATSIKKLHKM
jgi:translocation and assembly module TamA